MLAQSNAAAVSVEYVLHRYADVAKGVCALPPKKQKAQF